MVNSATAEALRPGVLTTSTPRCACRRHVDVDRPAAADRDQLQRRQAVEHGAGDRRQMVDQDRGAADELGDGVGIALILLQARRGPEPA